MGLDEKMARLQMQVLKTADEAHLTASERQLLFGPPGRSERERELEQRELETRELEQPSTPRTPKTPGQAGPTTAFSRHMSGHLTPQPALGLDVSRCFACDAPLRDAVRTEQGMVQCICESCGASNDELRERSERDRLRGGAWFGMRRELLTHGRLIALNVTLLGVAVFIFWSVEVLPHLTGATEPSRSSSRRWASTRHWSLTLILAAGVFFNLAATRIAGPGFVTRELNPLRAKTADGGWPLLLDELIDRDGKAPLHGWRRCAETGLSIPPRAHYCRSCRRIVLRMEYYCNLTNCCIGHRNYHYYVRLLCYLFCALAYVAGGCGFVVARALPAAMTLRVQLHPQMHGAAAAWGGGGGEGGAWRMRFEQPPIANPDAMINHPDAMISDPNAIIGSAPNAMSSDPNAIINSALASVTGQPGAGAMAMPMAGAVAGVVEPPPGPFPLTPLTVGGAVGGAVGGGLSLGGVGRQLSQAASEQTHHELLHHFGVILILGILSALGATLVAMLLSELLQNLSRGLTHVESCRRVQSGEYNLGLWRNVKASLGATPWLLLTQALPLPRAPEGDGIHFASPSRTSKVAPTRKKLGSSL